MTAAPERGPRWLEYVPLDDLRPDPRNPKNHRLDTLRESVVRWGYSEPVQVDERTGLIVSGHGRRELLLDDRATGRPAPDGVVVDGAGGWLVPVVRGWSSTDDDEAFGYLVAANRIGEQGGWLTERLLAGLEPLAAKGPDMLAGVGYTPDDLSGLLALLQSEAAPVVGATDPDEVPEPPPEPVSRRGDLWLCGSDHRVLCGDATVLADVERVVAGAKADMVWTDPPYGVDYAGGTADAMTIQNDSRDAAALLTLLRSALGNALATSRPGAAWFVAAPGMASVYFAFATVLAELDVWRHSIMWVKDQFVMGRSDYHYRHEPLFYGWAPGAAHRAPPDRTQDSVWEIPRPKRSAEHPTMKPVALVARAIENHTDMSDMSDVVLDPFGGSGTTLVACESTRRAARLVELDPHYTDVICRRYQEFTGEVPVLESTGEPHDFCAEPAVVEPAG